GCCRAALVRGLSSPELYATALMAAETAISTARRFGGEVPEAIGTSEGLFSATIGIGGTDTAEIGVNCVDSRSDGGVLIEGAAYPIADGGEERAFARGHRRPRRATCQTLYADGFGPADGPGLSAPMRPTFADFACGAPGCRVARALPLAHRPGTQVRGAKRPRADGRTARRWRGPAL
ncbi:MAG: hypothetical protein ACLSVD_14725, partial [Eggerthellaceae bacterium]